MIWESSELRGETGAAAARSALHPVLSSRSPPAFRCFPLTLNLRPVWSTLGDVTHLFCDIVTHLSLPAQSCSSFSPPSPEVRLLQVWRLRGGMKKQAHFLVTGVPAWLAMDYTAGSAHGPLPTLNCCSVQRPCTAPGHRNSSTRASLALHPRAPGTCVCVLYQGFWNLFPVWPFFIQNLLTWPRYTGIWKKFCRSNIYW